MANEFNAQGSVTIKRLRNGDTLYIMLDAKPALFQAVDTSQQSNNVTPDWTVASNQPTITPKCYASRTGITPKLSNHTWIYNGLELQFGSPGSDNWRICSNDSRFRMYSKAGDAADGSLKITGNLASNDNPANDTITYNATASVDGVEYQIQRSIDVIIHTAGASSYNAWITADDLNLTSEKDTVTLTPHLLHSLTEVSNYFIEWSKYGNTSVKSTDTANESSVPTFTVTRDMVDDTAIFIAKFYENSTAYNSGKGTPLCMASIRIDDIADEYEIRFTTSGEYVSEGKSVKVTATLYNATNQTKVDLPSTAVWKTKVLHPETLDELKTSESNSIDVSTDETDTTDSNGVVTRHDVIVVSEVKW